MLSVIHDFVTSDNNNLNFILSNLHTCGIKVLHNKGMNGC